MSESAKKRCTAEWRKNQSISRATPIDEQKVIETYMLGHTMVEVSEILKTTPRIVMRVLKNNNITTRKAVKRNQKGDKNNFWKGGKTISDKGYVLVKNEEHPRAKECGGYVYEHILIMENFLGRQLKYEKNNKYSEVVHHINGNKKDNRIENLQTMTKETHTKLHKEKRESNA